MKIEYYQYYTILNKIGLDKISKSLPYYQEGTIGDCLSNDLYNIEYKEDISKDTYNILDDYNFIQILNFFDIDKEKIKHIILDIKDLLKESIEIEYDYYGGVAKVKYIIFDTIEMINLIVKEYFKEDIPKNIYFKI